MSKKTNVEKHARRVAPRIIRRNAHKRNGRTSPLPVLSDPPLDIKTQGMLHIFQGILEMRLFPALNDALEKAADEQEVGN